MRKCLFIAIHYIEIQSLQSHLSQRTYICTERTCYTVSGLHTAVDMFLFQSKPKLFVPLFFRANAVRQSAVEPGAEPEHSLQASAAEGVPVHGQEWLHAIFRPHGYPVQRGPTVRLHTAQQEPQTQVPAAGMARMLLPVRIRLKVIWKQYWFACFSWLQTVTCTTDVH